MAEMSGSMKADILIRWRGSDAEPIEVGTVELPMRTEGVRDGHVQCTVDTSALSQAGTVIAAALEAEVRPPLVIGCEVCDTKVLLRRDGDRIPVAPLAGWTRGGGRWRCPEHPEQTDA